MSEKRTPIPVFSYATSVLGARLEAIFLESHTNNQDLVVDYHELCRSSSAELLLRDGQPYEHVQGIYFPRRLKFLDVRDVTWNGDYSRMDSLPLDHEGRYLRGILPWRFVGRESFYYFMNGSTEPSTLMFSARRYLQEDRPGSSDAVDTWRDWSPAPPLVPGLVPMPEKLHRRYGGNPITIQIGENELRRQLFVGGLDHQPLLRPWVDVVLNLGEDPSRWHATGQVLPVDRWACKGEGSQGMQLAEIVEEAQWVITCLRAGQRVLVHCSAGLNRSVTLCCAVLILLEGLSAEDALQRVRQHHAWARPDAHHWLALRWLAQSKNG